ncbi:SDR family NAD(P)-dependent oxidoreductase [Paenibacillus abyssi]|uniref:Short-chain dehydrogenase n=1 Tax=Paenibacillus abyssi TaxID=1340531 RepID=A0A917FKH2_9BACL|nr:SDR family oxidoreductase [Paenibacillus abyssi]GGF90539.1 short-chain dehydrogenase [Paenibacillus abyssi]
MPHELNGRVAVITGATRGIGKNMALLFAREGYTVVGTGRDEGKLRELEQELKGVSPSSIAIPLDVRNLDDAKRTAARVVEEFGRIDVWINNAGVFFAIGPTWEVEPSDWVGDVTTNLMGTFNCVHAAIPHMLKRGEGRIINLVGGGTLGEFNYGNAYGTSKTAIARFTENLASELAGTGLRSFALDPGLNDTDMTRYQRETPTGKKYLDKIEQLFEEHVDVPPSWAPESALQLASGALDAYNGRIVSTYDDADKLAAASSTIADTEHYTLRMTRLDGMSRTL